MVRFPAINIEYTLIVRNGENVNFPRQKMHLIIFDKQTNRKIDNLHVSRPSGIVKFCILVNVEWAKKSTICDDLP